MQDLVLRESEQRALCALTAADPVPGDPLPGPDVLRAVARLVPCDTVEVVLADNAGRLVALASLSAADGSDTDPQVCDGPLWLGVFHAGRAPGETDVLRALGLNDAVWIGFRNGADHVVQLCIEKRTRSFAGRDLAMARLIAPTMQRLMRERRTPQLPACLTLQERRVLMHVAAGRSNADIAAALFIAQSTVRKHLEHSFRKLGVTSRVAAVASLQGRDDPGLDLKERIARFA